MIKIEEKHHHFIIYAIPRIIFGLVSLAVLVFLVNVGQRLFQLNSNAYKPIMPRQVMVTNLTGQSATISWFTRVPVSGYVVIKSERGETLPAFLDDRVQNPSQGEFLTHYVSVKGLKPITRYFITIYSDNKKFSKNENGLVYDFKTLPLDKTPPPPPQNIFGRVIDVNGKPAKDVILYAYPAVGTPISTITDEKGSYVLNLLSSRDYSTGSVITTLEKKIKINVVQGEQAKSNMMVDLNEEGFIPTIQLGRDYDFSINYPIENQKVKAGDFEVKGVGRAGNKVQIMVK